MTMLGTHLGIGGVVGGGIKADLESAVILYAKLSEAQPGSTVADSGANNFTITKANDGDPVDGFANGTTAVGTGIDFDDTNLQHLVIADTPLLDLRHSFTIDGFFKMATVPPTSNFLISKYATDGGNERSWLVWFHSSNTLAFATSPDGIEITTSMVNVTGLGTNNTYYFVAAHDEEVDEIRLAVARVGTDMSVPAGVVDTPASTPFSTDSDIKIGAVQDTPISTTVFEGVQHDIGVYDRVLIRPEFEWRYNGGAGRMLY